jgi:subtilisin family serine protease
MASPHVAGVAALALQANPNATSDGVAQFILNNATPNRLSSLGTGSPNRLVYSLASGAPGVTPSQTVAIKSLSASAKKSDRNWQATVVATVRDIQSGAAVANATVSASFSPGAAAVRCLTSSAGSCSLASGSLPTTVTLTIFTMTGISGSNLTYDAGQNVATQIRVARP